MDLEGRKKHPCHILSVSKFLTKQTDKQETSGPHSSPKWYVFLFKFFTELSGAGAGVQLGKESIYTITGHLHRSKYHKM